MAEVGACTESEVADVVAELKEDSATEKAEEGEEGKQKRCSTVTQRTPTRRMHAPLLAAATTTTVLVVILLEVAPLSLSPLPLTPLVSLALVSCVLATRASIEVQRMPSLE